MASLRGNGVRLKYTPTDFRDLVSGRRQGWGARALRALLRIFEVPYSWGMRWRNVRYDSGKAEMVSVNVPVISVGNLTLGGTGKTPLVEWLGRLLRGRHVRVAIVSRGYGARASVPNDEALELELALPDVPHYQQPDRVAGARSAIADAKSEMILLDDGFQHRRLARDFDIVLLDATEPWGFEHVFPRGMLREPLSSLARADAVVLSRADMLAAPERVAIRSRIAQLVPEALWCEVEHRPQSLLTAAGETLPISAVRGERLAAFCGIGNPAGFRHTLEAMGANVVAWREFPDHHGYTCQEIESLARWGSMADRILCTRKDLVKLRHATPCGMPLCAVSMELVFLTGQAELEENVWGLVNRAK
ncbi:MAG: tetraacyldisaccharide 4'-kinase [Pirellulales bacterium]|nr:tetraacyldisaccharide 4'-kinase [Pirellulales bacterium]